MLKKLAELIKKMTLMQQNCHAIRDVYYLIWLFYVMPSVSGKNQMYYYKISIMIFWPVI